MIDEEEKAFILLARHGAQGTQYDAVRAQNDPCVAALTAKFKASKTRQHYTTALSWALTEWAHTTWQPNTDDQTALATLLNLHTPKDYINYRQITSAATESNNDLLLRLILSNQYFCQYVDTTRSFMGIPSDLTNAIYLKKDKTTAVWLEKEKEPNYYVLQLLIQAGASLDKLLSYCTGFTLNRIKKTETKGNFLLEKVFPKIPSPYDRDSRCDLLPVASLLIAQGCTSTHQDETGDTVLNYALRNGCHQDTSLTQFFTEVFKMGRKIDPRIPGDNRLLREAIELKRRNLAALLMENGALTYEATLEKNYNGDTLLDLAVLNGDDALLQRCLALRPDLTPDADTNLLLHAVQTNNEQVIGLIIKEELAQKATKVTDSAGNTVFNLALEKKNYDLFKRLLTIRRLDGRIEPDSKVLSQVHKLKDPALKALVDENWNTEVDDFSEAAASSDARTVAGLLAQDTTYGLANMHNRNFENKTALRLALTTDMPPKNPDIPFLKAAKSEFVRKQKTVQTLLTNNACATEKHTGQVKKKITTYRKIDDHLRTINDPHYHEKHTIITEIIHILEEMNALLKDYFNYEMD